MFVFLSRGLAANDANAPEVTGRTAPSIRGRTLRSAGQSVMLEQQSVTMVTNWFDADYESARDRERANSVTQATETC
jgi:hypothetical protein